MCCEPVVEEIDLEQVRQALERVPPQDQPMWQLLVETHLTLRRLVQERGTTIVRLRRLFGLPSSEKTADVLDKIGQGEPLTDTKADAERSRLPEGETAPEEAEVAGAQAQKPKRKGHGRQPCSAYPEACSIEVLHESLRPGDRCPACSRGKLYELSEPARVLRIVGQPPLLGVCWNCQRLRCGGCGEVFTARAPEGAQGPKHSESAAAMMAYLRFRAGLPHNRLQRLQRHLGTPLAASTQWDVLHERVKAPKAIYGELLRRGAQGSIVHNDDTYARILAFMGKRRAELLRQGELPDPERTGLFTTAVLSLEDGRELALFFTGRKHAGENLAELLRRRADEMEPPILMCDALDRNLPKGHRVVESNCASHARRHFVDQAVNFPHECRYLLESYGKVFQLDENCRTEGLSEVERLRRHQQNSGPVMEEMKRWMEAQLAQKRIEPNSGLGKAMDYMLKRWDKFTLFLRVPGAPLHNNAVERALKMAIRHRNNSLFYRNERGALVGDIYMTILYTAELQGKNPLHYLTELMLHEKAVTEDPAVWLPWTYRDTLAALRDAPPGQDPLPAPIAAGRLQTAPVDSSRSARPSAAARLPSPP